MAKKNSKIVYYCKECGYESIKWMGQCPSCKSWNTFVEGEKIDTEISHLGINISNDKNVELTSLSEIQVETEERIKTNIDEFDNVLGGGIVKGSITLIGGAPGIGKSTILLQLAKKISDNNVQVLYVSGEESLKQIKLRATRIGNFNDNVKFISSSELDLILRKVVEIKPQILIIDSIQTMSLNVDDKLPGSITQIKLCTDAIFRVSKEYGVSTFIVGHITKDGLVAGPKVLEHIVDTVLYFEDDTTKNLRLLRCKKNRFGSSDALAVFEMTSSGLREIKNPSEFFLEGHSQNAIGCVITCVIDSNRPILIEIQALVTKSSFGLARRTINGADNNKLNLLIAILEKKMNIPLYQYDIYINITGGLKIKDTAVDLPIIMAILSSYKEKSLGNDVVYCGEVGLTGEVRSITNINMRVSEAAKLGYKKIFIPKVNLEGIDKTILNKYKDLEIKAVKDVTS